MKVYVDIKNEKIIKTDDEDRSIYLGDENADAVKVYCNALPTYWWLSLACKMPNGREIPPRPHDGVAERIEVEDGTIWYMFTFTLSKSNGWIIVEGKNEFTLRINHTNTSNVVVRDKALGKFVINVNEAVEVDEDILIVGANAGEVIYQMKMAIENLASQIANDNNIKTVNQLIARLKLEVYDLLKAENGVITMTPTPEQTAYKVVFGHSYKEDEDDASTRRYYLMAVVNKEEPTDIIFAIDNTGKTYYKSSELLNKNDYTNLVNFINTMFSQLNDAKVNRTGDTITGALQVDGKITANGGVLMPTNYGVKHTDTNNGLFFHNTGSPYFVNSRGSVLTFLTGLGFLDYTFPDKDGSIMLEDDIKAELIKKLDVVVHQAFKVEMEAKHDEMVGEHNALANNLQAQINTIKEVLKSNDLSLDTFQEIVNVLKEAGAEIEAIFTQLGAKANTPYVDEQNELDRAYTDSQVNKAISDFNTAMAGHKLEVQDQVDDYKESTDSDIAQYKVEIQSYVDSSVGDIPAILDYLIEVA